MSECKTVTLRTRPLKNGMLSFYLDYYPGYRDQETMKTIRHEGLNIYIYANPKNQRERDFNATMSEKAEAIRFQFGYQFLFICRYLVSRLKPILYIDTKLLLFQIPDMPVTGKDFIIIAQEFLNGFSLGG